MYLHFEDTMKSENLVTFTALERRFVSKIEVFFFLVFFFEKYLCLLPLMLLFKQRVHVLYRRKYPEGILLINCLFVLVIF